MRRSITARRVASSATTFVCNPLVRTLALIGLSATISAISAPAAAFVSPGFVSAPLVPVDGLSIIDVVHGTGAQVSAGDTLSVHYVGKLLDGTQFDSSYARSAPFQFTLGKGYVIKGWELGFEGMRVGGVRRLVIAPALGYGAHGSPPKIPAGATIVFEVELLAIVK